MTLSSFRELTRRSNLDMRAGRGAHTLWGSPNWVQSGVQAYALIQLLSERDLEGLGWNQLGEARLREAWEGEDDALYDYL